MQRAFSFLAGAFVGALTGAALAVLFAPAPGKTTREDLQNRFRQMRHEMKQAAAARREELQAQLANLRQPR